MQPIERSRFLLTSPARWLIDMKDEDGKRTNEFEDDDCITAPSALESAESYLARSAGPGGASDGGGTTFSGAFRALLDWAEATGMIRAEADFSFFCRVADGNSKTLRAKAGGAHGRSAGGRR